MNTVTVTESFDTNATQMAEMSQWSKCQRKKNSCSVRNSNFKWLGSDITPGAWYGSNLCTASSALQAFVASHCTRWYNLL